MHRLRSGNPQSGPIFRNANGKPMSLCSLVNRVILPTLNRCETCHKAQGKCDQKTAHEYKRDAAFHESHGWHAARRGLGSNLNRLGVDDSVIQRILRHSNISTTQAYYIKTAADDVRNAMPKLENNIPQMTQAFRDTFGTLEQTNRLKKQQIRPSR